MKRHELIVIGAGPAGLSAAIEAKKNGMDVIVFDENQRPGGQLFKQIHKFFGSKEHHAKTRGFIIGQQLLKEAEDLGVRVELDSTVMGIYENKEVTVKQNGEVHHYKGDAIIIATGAAENMIPFKGWNIPGVIGAGAAQTMMNIQGVQPGSKILMVGSGNVGLVVSFQLLQAGCEVAAIIDAAPRVGGYGVHAAKVARCGVPFYLSHTIISADGEDCVTGVTIAEVGADRRPIPGTERHYDCDTLLLSCGLIPENELTRALGADISPVTNGPLVNERLETSVPGVFACGNVLHVHDLVDYVSQEAAAAGRAAANYAAEGETAAHEIPIAISGGARYTVPATLDPSRIREDLTVRFRVGSVMQNRRVVVTFDGEPVVQKKRPILAPGEMEQVVLTPAMFAAHPNVQDIKISIEEA